MPTATFIQDGYAVDYTPVSDVSAGDLVIAGNLLGIAKRDIPANTAGALAVRGVFEFTSEPLSNYGLGTAVYWNASELEASPDSDGGNRPLIGYAAAPSTASSSQKVRVLLRSAPTG